MNPPQRARWTIALVDGRDAHLRSAVSRLRRAAISGHGAGAAEWSAADDGGAVIGLWQGETMAAEALLATQRLRVFTRAAAAEAFVGHKLGGTGAQWPALVLTHAATQPGQSEHTLTALLRWAWLHALPAGHVRSVLTVVHEFAHRLRAMQALGYTFTVPALGLERLAAAMRPPLIAHLGEARFDNARAAASREVFNALPLLRWDRAGLQDTLLRLSLQAAQPEAEAARPWVPELLHAA